MRISALLVAAAFVASGCGKTKTPPATVQAAPAPAYDSAFWSHWGDGQAELSGYDLTYPRYGQLRRGSAVAIFVTEPFSNSARVKADPGKHPATDEFPVMKLNLVKDFQTGVYDYNMMLSSFVALSSVNGRPAGSLTKASFSSQEWCGNVYQQLLFDEGRIRSTSHSYFDGEADQHSDLREPEGGLSEDALLLWARGMSGPVLRPGESRDVQLLTSLETVRIGHKPLGWRRAVLFRSTVVQQIKVPAGSYEAESWQARITGGPTLTLTVERAAPHRILRWESSEGERAELLGAARMKYWTLNREGGDAALKAIGLAPRPPRTM